MKDNEDYTPDYTEDESGEMEALKENIDFFESQRDKIKKEYGENTFVVIENQRVIDKGLDKFVLHEKYPNERYVLISNIKSFKRSAELPSPEKINN